MAIEFRLRDAMAGGGASGRVIVLVVLCLEVLLSTSSEPCTTCSSSQGEPSVEAGESLLQFRSEKVSRTVQAKDELPDDLYQLGVQVFHTEEGLEKAVNEAQKLEIDYAGVKMSLRILHQDNAADRLGGQTEDGEEYGLDTLLDVRQNSDDMVNMIDMGGNYGAVTIAVFKKFPGLLRTVVLEPVAATYFFLRWNLWLNDVPYFTKEEFLKDDKKPGVVALYGGVPVTADEELLICVHPEWSMNAIAVAKFDAGWGCDCRFMNCTSVPRWPPDNLLNDFFGDSPISLMKMDCEGCESNVLPVLAKDPSRVKRLAGELHTPEEDLIDTSCLYDGGRYMTKVCKVKQGEWKSSLPLGCDEGEKRQKCNEFGKW